MVLTILWQFYMFLSAYESIQACQMMEELLEQVMEKLMEAQIHEEQALELHSPLPKSFKVCKETSKERGKIEDSSCSLLVHFWSTFRSPFYTCYIPFQSSGSRESNASNRVRFGVEMRKIWPSEDNCSRLVRNFRTSLAQLSSEGHIFLISTPNRTQFEALDS